MQSMREEIVVENWYRSYCTELQVFQDIRIHNRVISNRLNIGIVFLILQLGNIFSLSLVRHSFLK